MTSQDYETYRKNARTDYLLTVGGAISALGTGAVSGILANNAIEEYGRIGNHEKYIEFKKQNTSENTKSLEGMVQEMKFSTVKTGALSIVAALASVAFTAGAVKMYRKWKHYASAAKQYKEMKEIEA